MTNKLAVGFMILFFVAAGISIIRDEPVNYNNSNTFLEADYSNSEYKTIYFAGGCFWGVQSYFDNMLGVIYTDVGYINGNTDLTTYFYLKDTEHAEAVQVVYDQNKITLKELVEYFYRVIDPTELNKQGPDTGIQYRTGIYFVDEEDLEVVLEVTQIEQRKYEKEIVTEIEPMENYVIAEFEHQDYLIKEPDGYCHINLSNIPNQKPSINIEDYPIPAEEILREQLTEAQYMVTQQEYTELPYDNLYWEFYEKGIYVDIVSGEPLFLSVDKYDANSGWPTFTKPISREVITYHYDYKLEYQRIEVRSRAADSHLGHVFSDGLASKGTLRYCINSAALDFIPYEELDEKGYGKFKVYFE